MRASIDSETLVKVILLLVVVWLVLSVATDVLDFLGAAVGLFPNIIGLVIVVVIVLWLLDYL